MKGGEQMETLSIVKMEDVAGMIGCDLQEAGRVQSFYESEFFRTVLLDHVFCMLHEWEPFTAWESLPAEVRAWYEKAQGQQCLQLEAHCS